MEYGQPNWFLLNFCCLFFIVATILVPEFVQKLYFQKHFSYNFQIIHKKTKVPCYFLHLAQFIKKKIQEMKIPVAKGARVLANFLSCFYPCDCCFGIGIIHVDL